MRSIDVDTALSLPHLPADHRLRAVLAGALRKVAAPSEFAAEGPFWPASFFGLERVSAYQSAPPGIQRQIANACSASLLEEAWFIEKCGVVYMAQMVLLARSSEERQLYALFAADEAAHLSMMGAFLQNPHALAPNGFHELLATVIETADRATLIYVIQVVLEGWGLTHYRSLAKHCTHAGLKGHFEAILKDEARHHGAGAVLFDEASDTVDVPGAVALLVPFLEMVRSGPVAVVEAVATGVEFWDEAAREVTMGELDAVGQIRERTNILRKLMSRPGAQPMLNALDALGAFS